MELDTLKSLQKRIREATGPDRELDVEIARALRPGQLWCAEHPFAPEDVAPNYTTDPDGLGACVALCREVLRGYAWKVGTCCVSDDAWVVPDFNCPVHGARLREKFGQTEWGSIWDTGIDIDRRPSGNVCLAFLDAIFTAMIAELEAEQEKETSDVFR